MSNKTTIRAVVQASPGAGSDQTLTFDHVIPEGFKPIGTTIHLKVKGWKNGSAVKKRPGEFLRALTQEVGGDRTTMFLRATEIIGMTSLMTQSWRDVNAYGLAPDPVVIKPAVARGNAAANTDYLYGKFSMFHRSPLADDRMIKTKLQLKGPGEWDTAIEC